MIKIMQIRDLVEWLKRFDPTDEVAIRTKDGVQTITAVKRETHSPGFGKTTPKVRVVIQTV